MDRRQLLFGASALGLVTNLNLNHPLIAQVSNATMASGRRLSDRERAGLRGPVKTCSDLILRGIGFNTDYSPDGRLLGYRAVGAFPGLALLGIGVTDEFQYDEQGRTTRIRTVPPRPNQVGFTVMLASGMLEVTEAGGSLSADGSVTTRYNDDDQPIESLIHDAQGELLTQIVHNYANGLLVNETLVIVRENLEATRHLQKGFSEEEQRALLARRKALLGQLVGLRMERSYIYDDDRVIRRLTQMGNFKQDETITYNEHGCRAGTVTIQSGSLEPGEPILRVKRSEFRYLYQYDSHGNWTERTTINADHPGHPNTQRRTLSYYGSS
jgi:hypothetical protein